MRGRILFGTLLLVAGVAWILDLQGVETFPGGFSTWWPTLLVLWGVGSLVAWPRPRAGPFLWMGLGGILLADNLGYLPAPWWAYVLPSLLVLMGVGILVGIRRAKKRAAAWRAAHAAAFEQHARQQSGQRVFIDVENEANER